MIRFSFGKYSGSIKNFWEEITLAEFAELMRLELPEKLSGLYEAGYNLASASKPKEQAEAVEKYRKAQEEITDEDLMKIFPSYYGKAIMLLSDLSDEAIEIMPWDIRTQLYDTVIYPFVFSGLMSNPVQITDKGLVPYDPPSSGIILLNDEIFYFPESLKIVNEELPLGGEQVLPFTEAASIEMMFKKMTEDGIGTFPLFMAIYCRKDGEEYDDKVAMERQELFREARMSDVWSLFFYTEKLISRYTKNIEEYSEAELKKLTEKISGSEDLFMKSLKQELLGLSNR